jgi:hypothetical protein
MKHIIVISFFLVFFVSTAPVFAQSLQPGSITPTLFCLGSLCPTLAVSPSPSNSTNPTAIPSNTNPSSTVSTQPSTQTPSSTPCIASVRSSSVHTFKAHKHISGALSQLINLILQFIIKLIEQLLGINLGHPSTGTPQPTSVPVSSVPSAPVPSVNPSVIPCATQAPSTTPSGFATSAPTPSVTATNAPTNAIIPTTTTARSILCGGYTPGPGTGESHNTPDLTGWETAQPYAGPACTTKLFDPPAGYPNLWTNWSASLVPIFEAHNGGHALNPLIVFDNVPTAANFEMLMGSMPAGAKAGFIYQSEAENTKSGITGPVFVANWAAISTALNTALTFMTTHPVSGNSPSFYVRANFPMINSAYMDYYSTNPGSTAYLPPPSQVDAYGADFYQHIGGSQDVGMQNDPRWLGYLKAVQTRAGLNPKLAFPEYGISIPSYTAANEAARAALLNKDIAYLTGSSRPEGTASVMVLNYWYQMDVSPKFYSFPLADGTETAAQATATINVWQAMLSATSGSF